MPLWLNDYKLFKKERLTPYSDKNVFLSFIKMIVDLTDNNHGSGGMVIPLSFSYNRHNEFKKVRKLLWNRLGDWDVAHFDRTPDSLFGDDVKTRNNIVFHYKGNSNRKVVKTTDFIRWNSRKRKYLRRKFKLLKCFISNRTRCL